MIEMIALNFFSNDLESLGYFVKIPSTAVEEEADSSINASQSSGSFKYGFVSFNDFLGMFLLYYRRQRKSQEK